MLDVPLLDAPSTLEQSPVRVAIEIAVNGIKFESGLKNRARDLEHG